MEGVMVLMLGGFLVLMSIWWLVHLTYNYERSQHHHQAFDLLLISTEYKLCKVIRIEGLFKLIFGVTLAAVAISQKSKSTFLENREVGTISLFLCGYGLHDTLNGILKSHIFSKLDWMLTISLFAILNIFFGGYCTVIQYPQSTLYSLSFLTGISVCVCLILERKFCKEVIFGVMRNYLILLLGTWMIEANFLVEDSFFPLNQHEASLKIAVYFSWHCGLDFVIVVCVWNIIYKLSTKNHCYCMSAGIADSTINVVYLENRVHLDMNILGRLESDNEL